MNNSVYVELQKLAGYMKACNKEMSFEIARNIKKTDYKADYELFYKNMQRTEQGRNIMKVIPLLLEKA